MTGTSLKCGKQTLVLGERTYIMGIVNVTPDSFSDGGRFVTPDDAVRHACRLVDAGADILDIGGESTRPGADPTSPKEEQRRILPVIEALVARGIDFISVDTRNASTAKQARRAGAAWLNDVSGMVSETMRAVAADFDGVVVMHARGDPKTMQSDAIIYDDVVQDVARFLEGQVETLERVGVSSERILVDPGLGFGKNLEHNLALSRNLRALRGRAAGVVYGPSRKRFLGELTGQSVAMARDPATVAAVALSVATGADIVRVHDVGGALQATRLADGWLRKRG
jgi:dihydropteroate synthase